MSVLAVMRRLRSELDSGNLRPYSFIEINGLKLASPENIYKVCRLLSWLNTMIVLVNHISHVKRIIMHIILIYAGYI